MKHGKTTNPMNEAKPFWIDTLTLQRYDSKAKIPPGIPKERLQHWDSLFEFSFYQKISNFVDKRLISIHFPLQLLPKTSVFPKLDWKIDFRVGVWFVECKGSWINSEPKAMADFVKTLRLFEIAYPYHFKNFLLVGDTSGNLSNTKVPIITIEEAIGRIKNENV